MRSQVTLLLLCMLLSVAFSLQCYTCVGQICSGPVTCPQGADRCMTSTAEAGGQKLTVKRCSSKSECDVAELTKLVSCCDKDLCNGSERFTLSFLLMLVPLLPSILFY